MPQLRIIEPSELQRLDELDEEAFLARAEGKIRGYGKLVISGIVEIGRELVAVKSRHPGRYGEFVSDRLGWADNTALRYVRSYQLFLRKSDMVSDLPIDGIDDLHIDARSLYLIAAPSTPDDV